MSHTPGVFTPEAATVVVVVGIAIAVYAHRQSRKTNGGSTTHE